MILDEAFQLYKNVVTSLFSRVFTLHHVLVGVVSDGEQMGWHFHSPLAPVLVNDGVCVDWETTVGVDGHTEQTGVGLYKGGRKTQSGSRLKMFTCIPTGQVFCAMSNYEVMRGCVCSIQFERVGSSHVQCLTLKPDHMCAQLEQLV